ncbi:nucleotide-diphospho-sugar transferase [Cycloclasticus sp.]|uniref:nucleotide-diphospho-sugar transferase n=1 Tax=Cycloclasticus sp. TaxID=2024830 RepID=UPI000C0C7C40|nr:nucleotide-diphospho-sugar transferase [Cycloclasticus sp.]PHR51629.1 MAG: nucleotide-diphospho-sugar transferase [Cycloclasticus sp.]
MRDKFTPPKPLNTAVLFLIFNRLDVTKQVFQAIRQAKPPRLYLAADGARKNTEGEAEKVIAVREYALQNIDWDCEVKTLFRDKNLGCKYAVSGAIDWFFEQEEMGIILEDDCLPSQSFFWFCEELLGKYKEDKRVFLISGYNKQNIWKNIEFDYFFSSFGGIWGWASWRRAWAYYDVNMSDLDVFSSQEGFENLLGRKVGKARKSLIKSVEKKKVDTWDYQWAYTRHKNGALACVPTSSMVENIGFGVDATHTVNTIDDGVRKNEVSIPLRDNPFFVPDREYDRRFIVKKPVYWKLVNKLSRFLRLLHVR